MMISLCCNRFFHRDYNTFTRTNLLQIVLPLAVLFLVLMITPVSALDPDATGGTQAPPIDGIKLSSGMSDAGYFSPVTLEVPPADSADSDYYVSFHMVANSPAPGYAYDLITRGDPSDGNKWVYNFYLFGVDSDGYTSRIAVFGMNKSFTGISPLSEPLEIGKNYYIVWKYSDSDGGKLFINNISQGAPVKGGGVNNSLSSAFHTGERMYTGAGRQHSAFNGVIYDVSHYDKDLSPGQPGSTGSVPGIQDPAAVIDVNKTISPVSIKQETDAQVTIILTNSGTAPVHDIEILDTTLPEFPVVTGKTQYVIPLQIEPNETRMLSYTVHATEPGSFVLNKTLVMYAGADGNYHMTSSNAPEVNVIEPLIPEPTTPAGSFLPDIGKSIFSFFRIFSG
jgi:Translocon-associated protein beta (TRAPB)